MKRPKLICRATSQGGPFFQRLSCFRRDEERLALYVDTP
jgi:hypothetical protein